MIGFKLKFFNQNHFVLSFFSSQFEFEDDLKKTSVIHLDLQYIITEFLEIKKFEKCQEWFL